MSTRAKITLAGSFVFCGFTIWGVHYLQRYEKEVGNLQWIEFLVFHNTILIQNCLQTQLMRAGLVREEERQQRKLQQQANKEELDAQKLLHEQLIKSQSVKPTTGLATDSA